MRLLVAAALLLVGGIWVGQGLGFIHGSFMTGSGLWAAIGAVCVIVGAAIMYVTLSERRRSAK